MKKQLLFTLTILAVCFNLHSQKASYFLDLGINHSGFENKFPPYQPVTTYRNFNPNFSIALGTEIPIRKKFCFITSIGWRVTGSKYIDTLLSSLSPRKVLRTEANYNYIHQINIPMLIGIKIGKKANFKPFLGINNNFNYYFYRKNQSTGYYNYGKDFLHPYAPYAMVGLIFEKKKLFHEKIGLGIKCSYEQNLLNLRKEDYGFLILNQKILSITLQINYSLY